jgi:molybdopterin-guanine dinucleotide biosynthesis protein A
MTVSRTQVAGVLLAGGRSSRMGGGDKSLRSVGGRTILERVVERARPQVGALVLNANGDPARFARVHLPVAADVVPGYAGPLAGILTGLEWARANAPGALWLASFATDAPFFPLDLVACLAEAIRAEAADLACAASAGRTHPVFGLWPLALAGPLRQALVEEGLRKIDRWTERYKVAEVGFVADPVDPFFNVNDPESLAGASRFAALLDAAEGGAAPAGAP